MKEDEGLIEAGEKEGRQEVREEEKEEEEAIAVREESHVDNGSSECNILSNPTPQMGRFMLLPLLLCLEVRCCCPFELTFTEEEKEKEEDEEDFSFDFDSLLCFFFLCPLSAASASSPIFDCRTSSSSSAQYWPSQERSKATNESASMSLSALLFHSSSILQKSGGVSQLVQLQ